METEGASFQCGSPPKPLPGMPQASADFYYLKAMEYLGGSSENAMDQSSDGEAGFCNCGHRCRNADGDKEEEDRFGFRPGLTHDDEASPGGSGSSGSSTQCSSPTCSGGREAGTVRRRRAVSLGSPPCPATAAGARQRKLSIGSFAYGRATDGKGSDAGNKDRRKLSDGHVHWADEFQKDLTRSHPRKSYNRHPSHFAAHVKPILKPNQELEEEGLGEELEDDQS